LGKVAALAVASGVSLLAIAMVMPTQSVAQRGASGRAPLPVAERGIGRFTPAVRDPRLAAELARRSQAATKVTTAFQFTPATTQPEAPRDVRVAIRVRPGLVPPERARPVVPGAAAAVETASGTQITPSSYNLGIAVGWRRFAITGETSGSRGGAVDGNRDATRVGAEYRATPRLTARVQVAAERAEGVQRVVSDDRAVALDVGGSYSIARNIDVTGGVRYRVSRDRIEPLARDERRDSQSVYIGTALRF